MKMEMKLRVVNAVLYVEPVFNLKNKKNNLKVSCLNIKDDI